MIWLLALVVILVPTFIGLAIDEWATHRRARRQWDVIDRRTMEKREQLVAGITRGPR